MTKGATRYAAIAFVIAAAIMPTKAYISHTVEKGETLWGLSHKYGVSADSIIALNPSVANGLKAGTTIKIPDTPEQPSEPETPKQANAQSAQDTDNATEYQRNDAYRNETNKSTENINGENINYVEYVGELPVVRQSATPGEDTFVARFGDTFQSISKKTGISVQALAAYNPLIDGYAVPEGEVIRLTANAPYASNREIFTLVDSVVYHVQKPISYTRATIANDNSIAILLPFDLTHDEISRQSLLATDFYKGFLMATKENSDRINGQLRIYAIDTQCSDDELREQLMKLAQSGVKIVVPPDDAAQTEIIEKFAADNGMTVVNILNIKDEGHLTYPNVVQCNISQKLMYDKAINTLLTDYEEFTPVILDLAGGKDEKMSFIEELRSQYAAQDKEVLDLSFNHMLSENELTEVLKPDKKYIFIPKSGSIEVFERFHNALSSYFDNDTEYGRLKLFGYPDWVTFRGESEEALHHLGAVIYSRFYFDPTNTNAEDFNKDFSNWYGSPQNDVFPSQGTMGYDAGNMLYRMIKDSWIDTMTGAGSIGSYDGLQSAYHLVNEDGTPGVINDALYIIEFIPEGTTYVKII